MSEEKKNPWNIDGPANEYADIVDMKFEDDHTHKIRILPAKEGLPFYRYISHWVPQANSTKSFPVNHDFETRCPIDEYISEIWTEINRLKEEDEMTEKSPEVKKLYAIIEGIRAQKKCDMNIIDRDDMYTKDKEGGGKKILIKRLAANATIWKEIFSYASNPKWGNPSDEEKGYDFEIITEGEGKKRKYSIVPDRDSSPLTDEEKEAIERCYDLKKLRKTTSLKDMKKLLSNAKAPYDALADKINVDSDEESHEQPARTAPPKSVPRTEVPAAAPKKAETVVKNEEAPKAEPKVESDGDFLTESSQANPDDETNLDNYSCKGEFDGDNADCASCPVKDKCTDYKPFYAKALELGISADPDRNYQEVISDVKKKTEVSSSGPKLGKKKIPF